MCLIPPSFSPGAALIPNNGGCARNATAPLSIVRPFSNVVLAGLPAALFRVLSSDRTCPQHCQGPRWGATRGASFFRFMATPVSNFRGLKRLWWLRAERPSPFQTLSRQLHFQISRRAPSCCTLSGQLHLSRQLQSRIFVARASPGWALGGQGPH